MWRMDNVLGNMMFVYVTAVAVLRHFIDNQFLPLSILFAYFPVVVI